MNIRNTLKDPRVVYPIIFILVAAPLIQPIGLPLTISKEVRSVYDYLSQLPPESNVVAATDLQFTNWPELGGAMKAIFAYVLKRDLRLVAVEFSHLAQGTTMAEQALAEIQIPPGNKYGVDYVNIGYIPGEEGAIASFARDMLSVAVKDARGNSLNQLPIMKRVTTIKDIALWISIGGYGGEYPERYLRQLQASYGTKIASVQTAGISPGVKPYVLSGQLIGLIPSVRGSAEFEKLTGLMGQATILMDSQSLVPLFTIVAVALANIDMFATKLKVKKK